MKIATGKRLTSVPINFCGHLGVFQRVALARRDEKGATTPLMTL